MMNVLDKIVAHKRKEVAAQQKLVSVKALEQSLYFDSKPISMKKHLLQPNASGIIAEFKRKSPSEGVINDLAQVANTTIGYRRRSEEHTSELQSRENLVC